MANQSSPHYQYQSEIGAMMFTFGEVRHPLNETTQMMEQLVHSQITEMLIKAAIITRKRGARFISHEDLIFLIRRDRLLVARLTAYLSWRKVRKIANRTGSSANEAVDDEMIDESSSATQDEKMRIKKQQVSLPWSRFNRFEETLNAVGDSDSDEDTDEEDKDFYRASRHRLLEKDRQTRDMSRDEYMDFADCRQASFTYKKPAKFREWLDIDKILSSLRPNNDLLDIIGFICYEMVRSLTEQALTVKRESDRFHNIQLYSGNSPKGEELALGLLEKELKEQFKPFNLFANPNQHTPLDVSHLREAYRRLQQNESILMTSGSKYRNGFKNSLRLFSGGRNY